MRFTEARDDLSTYRDILEISDRIKIVELIKKEFSKPKKNFPTADSNFKNGGENTFSAGASSGGLKNREVQVQGSTTLKMWNALSATKRDIMLISVLNLRPKKGKQQ